MGKEVITRQKDKGQMSAWGSMKLKQNKRFHWSVTWMSLRGKIQNIQSLAWHSLPNSKGCWGHDAGTGYRTERKLERRWEKDVSVSGDIWARGNGQLQLVGKGHKHDNGHAAQTSRLAKERPTCWHSASCRVGTARREQTQLKLCYAILNLCESTRLKIV